MASEDKKQPTEKSKDTKDVMKDVKEPKDAKLEEQKKQEETAKDSKGAKTGNPKKIEERHVKKPIGRSKTYTNKPTTSFDADSWKPKTDTGKKVKSGEITNVDEIINSDKIILETQIVDFLIPTLESELLLIGQSKGKFGGGQRRVFKQTQKKTREGNKPSFATYAVVGDRNGHVGLGYGKSRETVPAREKATRKAKLNLINIRRGCGSWQCNCSEHHSIPFEVSGKCGSVKVTLLPAPKGTGLKAGSEISKILDRAGIQDVWSRTSGKTTSRINMIKAVTNALKELMTKKVQTKYKERLNITE